MDGHQNISKATLLTAPDRTAPSEPTALALSNDGLSLTGQAEAGSTVVVKKCKR